MMTFRSLSETFVRRSCSTLLPVLATVVTWHGKKSVVRVAQWIAALILVHRKPSLLSRVHCFLNPSGTSVSLPFFLVLVSLIFLLQYWFHVSSKANFCQPLSTCKNCVPCRVRHNVYYTSYNNSTFKTIFFKTEILIFHTTLKLTVKILTDGLNSAHCYRYRPSVTDTHPFNGPFSRTTQVSQYQKGKTDLDFTEARESEWQWHQLGHMQVCTLLQAANHASTPPLSFLQAGWPSCHPTNSAIALTNILY